MKSLSPSPGAWKALAATCFVGAIAVWFIGCSAMPVLQGDLDEVQQDQADAARAAENGNLWRTIISGSLALIGSIGVAQARAKRYDAQPFEGTVAGRTVKASEDDIVAVVEAARADGKIKS